MPAPKNQPSFKPINGSGWLGPTRAGWARPSQKRKKRLGLGFGPSSPNPFYFSP